MTNFAKRVVKKMGGTKPGIAVRRAFVSSRVQASLVNWMAWSGEGTDRALKAGALPLPVQFYSPVPDITDLADRGVWQRRSAMSGVAFDSSRQESYLLDIGKKYGMECDWPAENQNDPSKFYSENQSFSFGCAGSLHCIVRNERPKRVVEVGSGMSSIVLSAALRMNESQGLGMAEYKVIDPYPSPYLRTLPGTLPAVVPERVELVSLSEFERLQANDILFIDGSHVVRIGGDVNYLILDVLPQLNPGVIVHIHDISLPFEYPKVYYTNPRFRVFWTEAYLLQAFLACNDKFEILLGMEYLMKDRLEVVRRAFPRYDPSRHKAVSGSFWIRRRVASAGKSST